MTILQAYTVLDIKTAAYLPPYFMRTNGEAIRAFSDAVNQANHQFNMHPADYILFYIGNFDDIAGELQPTAHDNLGKALDFITETGPELFQS